jgi:nitrous oxidase accessory protein NosD
MWKVKRMNTACIVVLANSAPPSVVRQATILAARQAGTLSLAQRCMADVNAVESSSTDQLNMRGAGISVIRYGVASQSTVQK